MFARRRAYQKKVGVAPFDGIISTDGMVFRPKPNIYGSLLPFIVKSDHFMNYAINNSAGTMSPRVKWKDLQNCEIKIPENELQKKYSDLLWHLENTIILLNERLTILDQLVKSRFIEMFQPFFNLEECVSLESLCNTFVDGDWIESKDQDTSGIRLIQTGNVGISKYLDKADKARFINEETFERLNCTEVLPGDILISRLPDPIARSCIIPDGLGKSITGVDCTIVRFKDRINPVFFNQYTLIDHYLSQISAFEAGSTRKRISRKNLGKIKVPLPPMDLQNQFASFVEQVDKSKVGVLSTILLINIYINTEA